METTIRVDTRRFFAATEDLAKIVAARNGTDFDTAWERTLKVQGQLVLEAAMRGTPAASPVRMRRSIENQAQWRESGDSSGPRLFENDGRRGGKKGQHWLAWPERSKRAKGRHPGEEGMFLFVPNKRLSPEMRAQYARLKKELADKKRQMKLMQEKAVKARGLAKQSWLQIAQKAGITLRNVPAYVVNARARNGYDYVNGTAQNGFDGTLAFIDIINTYPYLVKSIGNRKRGRMDGERILRNALNGRASAFGHEMRNGVFEDLATVAKRYPGLFDIKG